MVLIYVVKHNSLHCVTLVVKVFSVIDCTHPEMIQVSKITLVYNLDTLEILFFFKNVGCRGVSFL